MCVGVMPSLVDWRGWVIDPENEFRVTVVEGGISAGEIGDIQRYHPHPTLSHWERASIRLN